MTQEIINIWNSPFITSLNFLAILNVGLLWAVYILTNHRLKQINKQVVFKSLWHFIRLRDNLIAKISYWYVVFILHVSAVVAIMNAIQWFKS